MNEITLVIIWILVMIIFIVIEALTLNFITIWFAIAAIGPIILTLFGVNITIQLGVYLITSLILMLSTRKVTQMLQKGKNLRTNYETIIGETGTAKESFEVGEFGYVDIKGMDWKAFSDKDDINVGDKIIVLDVRGSRVVVKKK